MSIKYDQYFEDNDYQRYYNLFGDMEIHMPVDQDEWSTDELLLDDEISDAEEGFLKGYDSHGLGREDKKKFTLRG